MNDHDTSEFDRNLARALSHPLRQRILRRLNEAVASPKRVADALGEPIGKVSYHVAVLRDCGAIELVETRPVRGAVEHFYRPLARPFFDDEHWATLPASVRQSLFGQTLGQIFTDVSAASEEHGLDDPRTHVSWTTMELDAEGFDKLAALLGDVLEQAATIQAEASERLGGGEGEHRTELAVLHFERAGRPVGTAPREREREAVSAER